MLEGHRVRHKQANRAWRRRGSTGCAEQVGVEEVTKVASRVASQRNTCRFEAPLREQGLRSLYAKGTT